ncbi:MAG: hypothetical protein ACRC2K_05225, partial [Clostridium sp.]
MGKILKRTLIIVALIVITYFIVTIVVYNFNKVYSGESNDLGITYKNEEFIMPKNTRSMNQNINYFKSYYYLSIPIKLCTPILFI